MRSKASACATALPDHLWWVASSRGYLKVNVLRSAICNAKTSTCTALPNIGVMIELRCGTCKAERTNKLGRSG